MNLQPTEAGVGPLPKQDIYPSLVSSFFRVFSFRHSTPKPNPHVLAPRTALHSSFRYHPLSLNPELDPLWPSPWSCPHPTPSSSPTAPPSPGQGPDSMVSRALAPFRLAICPSALPMCRTSPSPRNFQRSQTRLGDLYQDPLSQLQLLGKEQLWPSPGVEVRTPGLR